MNAGQITDKIGKEVVCDHIIKTYRVIGESTVSEYDPIEGYEPVPDPFVE